MDGPESPSDESEDTAGTTGSQQIVVGFEKNLDTPEQANVEEAFGPDLPEGSTVIKRNRNLGYIVIELPGDTAVSEKEDVKSRLEGRDGVEFSEDRQQDTAFVTVREAVSGDIEGTLTTTPSDPLYSSQYAPQNISAPGAWDEGFGDSDVVIAVSDQGIKYDHEDLAANMDDTGYVAPDGASTSYDSSKHGWDFSSNLSNGDETDPYPDDLTSEWHGSAVAGCAAAVTDNGTGMAGISNCSVLSLRTLDPGYHDDISDGLEWAADQGVDVINMSHGGSDTTAKYRGIEYAHNQGVVLIAAAGNNNNDADSVEYPSAYSEVIAVSSVDANDDLASHSSIGPEVELAAPGQSVYGTYHNPGDTYATVTGTSFASPITSGVAGLVLSANPTLSKSEVRDILTSTADDVGLADNEQGEGRVNANTAVQEAISRLPFQEPFSQKWTSNDLGDAQFNRPAVDANQVYVGGLQNAFYALSRDDGESVGWSKDRGTNPGLSDSSAHLWTDPSQPVVFIGSGQGKLYAVTADDGSEHWSGSDIPDLGSAITSSPTSDGGTIVAGTNDGRVLAWDGGTATQQWAVSVDGAVYSDLAAADGLVYVTTENGSLHVLDTSTGAEQWKDSSFGAFGSSSPALGNGRVYVAADEVHAFDAASSKNNLWTSSGYGGTAGSNPTYHNGTVYVGSADGNLYALDAANGSENWTVSMDGAVAATPAVNDDGTRIAVASMDGTLYLVDSSGNQQDTVSIPADTRASPVLDNGELYLPTASGVVHAFE